MSRKQLICDLSTLLLCAGFVAPAWADFVAIPDPNAAYLTTTNLLPVIGNEFDTLTSVTDGINTATFFVAPNPLPTPQTIYDVGSGWSTWSSPPNSESATPRVLGATPQLEIQLTSPALVFGFEAEPNLFGLHSITADFFGSGVFRGSVTRNVDGNGGALLFAGFSSMGIDDVQISSADNSDFGVAQLRYGNTSLVPEPKSVLLLAGLAVLLCWCGSRQVSGSRPRA
jgi:hypothetical protein